MAKRRTFTAEFKARVVLEVISGMKSAAEICREHNIKPPLLYTVLSLVVLITSGNTHANSYTVKYMVHAT